jgi:hypothetical protein
MTEVTNDSLLAQLAGQAAGADPWAALAASPPKHAQPDDASDKATDEKLGQLLDRIRDLATPSSAAELSTAQIVAGASTRDSFIPLEPATFAEAGLTTSAVEGLMLKMLLSRGDTTGRQISEHLRLPFLILDELLRQMKADQLVVHKGSAPMNDYLYQLTDIGRERARRLAEHCTYFGAAPVGLRDYIAAVAVQSLTKQHPTSDDLSRAFDDLLINKRMLRRLGPAIN